MATTIDMLEQTRVYEVSADVAHIEVNYCVATKTQMVFTSGCLFIEVLPRVKQDLIESSYGRITEEHFTGVYNMILEIN